jgi:hypothetical protein
MRAITGINTKKQQWIMAIHRITAEIADQRIQMYQGNFNVDDNGDLGMQYLMKEIDAQRMKTELMKREVKRNKHLAIRAILEMFVTTSTMMLNNISNSGQLTREAFEMTALEYINLRKYVNDSLMIVSKMKACSVPQIGEKWEWKQFNKAGKVEAAAPAPATSPAPAPSPLEQEIQAAT